MLEFIYYSMSLITSVSEKLAANEQGLLLCWYFIMSSPELKPNRINDDEVKNKSSIEFGQPEPLLIANKKMRNYSSVSIAANPMLYVRPSS